MPMNAHDFEVIAEAVTMANVDADAAQEVSLALAHGIADYESRFKPLPFLRGCRVGGTDAERLEMLLDYSGVLHERVTYQADRGTLG